MVIAIAQLWLSDIVALNLSMNKNISQFSAKKMYKLNNDWELIYQKPELVNSIFSKEFSREPGWKIDIKSLYYSFYQKGLYSYLPIKQCERTLVW